MNNLDICSFLYVMIISIFGVILGIKLLTMKDDKTLNILSIIQIVSSICTPVLTVIIIEWNSNRGAAGLIGLNKISAIIKEAKNGEPIFFLTIIFLHTILISCTTLTIRAIHDQRN